MGFYLYIIFLKYHFERRKYRAIYLVFISTHSGNLILNILLYQNILYTLSRLPNIILLYKITRYTLSQLPNKVNTVFTNRFHSIKPETQIYFLTSFLLRFYFYLSHFCLFIYLITRIKSSSSGSSSITK
jgi:hypothetical protein